jgi:hypothetical protein
MKFTPIRDKLQSRLQSTTHPTRIKACRRHQLLALPKAADELAHLEHVTACFDCRFAGGRTGLALEVKADSCTKSSQYTVL